MGLFDKKYCDICGEKIGLLGNRKLEDGNLCKNCAKKLSPWFSERRKSTVADIKEQLEWREANRERAAQFRTTRSYGERTRLLLDETHGWFAVTCAVNPADDNSDVLDFSAITGCRADIDDRRTELKIETKDSDGKIVRKSYSPPRYEYDYDFYITISVNIPYFSEMKLKLNDYSVHVPFRPSGIRQSVGGLFKNSHDEPMYDPCYRGFKEACDEICSLLESIRSGAMYGGGGNISSQYAVNVSGAISDDELARAIKAISWKCPKCNLINNGTTVCRMCGAPLTDESVIEKAKTLAYANAMLENTAQNWSCPFCGAENHGNFCESCGSKRP